MLSSHCNACKVIGGSAFTLNQLLPKDKFKITKGDVKCYTYKGDSGMFLIEHLKNIEDSLTLVYQATRFIVTTAPTAPRIPTTTRPLLATRTSCEPPCSRAQRSGMLHLRFTLESSTPGNHLSPLRVLMSRVPRLLKKLYFYSEGST